MLDKQFPRLMLHNHRVTSPASFDYNCIAWAAGDTQHWWQPGGWWPKNLPLTDFSIAALELAFLSLGYADCEMDDSFEPGFEKVVLYSSGPWYTHAARQLRTGEWTSKLGKAEDIQHDSPDALAGGIYGEVVRIMKRPNK